MTTFWRELGYSEDSGDIFVGFFELDYRRTKNPMCAWNAILRINEMGSTDYPKWIRDYLVESATNLKACDPKPKGKHGVVAAFGFKSCSQLHEPDIDKITLAYELMREKVQLSRTSIEDAAYEVENELNQGDLKPMQRGYLGNSAIEKLYREINQAED